MSNLHLIYDMGENPVSYDFPMFLGHVEKHRLKSGHDGLDVHFMPGKTDRFYERYFPKDNERREGLLWRVAVPSCQFVKSVRSVTVHSGRDKIEGDKYPASWDVGSPTQEHGSHLMTNVHRCFHASKWAKDWVNHRFKEPYFTVTIRECDYCKERNSDREQWRLASKEIQERYKLKAVIVPDTYGTPFPDFYNCVEAAYDIDIRLALYEKAFICLGVANGPMTLCMLSDTTFMLFNNDYHSGWGFDNGQVYREKDDRGFIVNEFDRYYRKAYERLAIA